MHFPCRATGIQPAWKRTNPGDELHHRQPDLEERGARSELSSLRLQQQYPRSDLHSRTRGCWVSFGPREYAVQLQILAVEAERRILLVRRRPNIPLYGSEGQNAGIVVVIVVTIVRFELHVLRDPAGDGVVHRQGLYVSMQAGFR